MDEKSLAQKAVADVNALATHTEEVEDMLNQTLRVLGKMGASGNFDIAPIIRKGRVFRRDAQKSSKRVATQLHELNSLVHVSALVTTSLEIDSVLYTCMDTVIDLTGAENVYLMLLPDEEQGNLQVKAGRNSKGENIPIDEAIFSRGVITEALEGGQPIITTNAQEDERFQNMASVISSQLRSIIVIPMILQGRPIGVFYLDNRLANAVFHQDSLPIVAAFANQAAIAIENARLFQRVQENLEQAKQEVQRLQIQIDQQKLSKDTQAIVDTEYFQDLASRVKKLRGRGDGELDEDLNDEA